MAKQGPRTRQQRKPQKKSRKASAKKQTPLVERQHAGLAILTLGLFFFSGAFALVYEVSWVRAITLEFGSTTLAVSTVLTVFMGGLALGAWLIGSRIDTSQRPLTIYGYLELALAGYTLATPLLFKFLLPAFSQLVYGFSDSFFALVLTRFLAASVLLLLPTMLMGATLPVLSRFWAMRKTDSGKWAGILYGINTIGAFVGTALGGFMLLPNLGLSRTLYVVASCNIVLGLIAFAVGRKVERPAKDPERPTVASPSKAGQVHWPIYVAVMLTGFAALTCEVAWTRTLVLILGASVYAFSIVLATFLAGLGFGSAAIAAFLKAAPERARTVFYGLALAAAIVVAITSATFQHLPTLFLKLYAAWNLEQQVDNLLLVQVLLSAGVMVAPSFIMGGLFPAAARVVVRDPKHTGQSIGRLYAWNTTGSILGSFTAGFLLIPLVGIRGTLLVAVAAQVIGGIMAVMKTENKQHVAYFAGAGLATLVLLVLLTPPWHHQLMASAVYHYADAYENTTARGLERELARNEELLFYKDGLTATVTVTRDNQSENHDLYISTNGKIDGSSHYDMPTQRLSAHLPLLLHPNPQQICVIGMGTGCTAGSAGLHPVEQVTLIEIEEAMVEGARFFREHNHAVHENPRVDIRITDGRLFLNHKRQAFDVIISEPSNPWLAGVSDLFTREFFELGARALHDDGLFAQWVQLYSMSSENLKTIVRTFISVFPYTYLVSTIPDTDLLLIGSKTPFTLDLERAHERLQQPEIQADLADARVGINDVFDLAARIRMGPEEVRAFAGSGILHTDDLPIIAYRAPRDLYKNTRTENMTILAQYARGVGSYLEYTEDPAQRRLILRGLAASYRRFLPNGQEARYSEELAGAQADSTQAQ